MYHENNNNNPPLTGPLQGLIKYHLHFAQAFTHGQDLMNNTIITVLTALVFAFHLLTTMTVEKASLRY